MTVSNSNNRTTLSISGYDYDFTFRIDDESELLVYTLDALDAPTLLTLGVDYLVTDIDTVTEGGTIQTGSYILAVWTPAAPSGVTIKMIRNKPYTQAADIPVRGGFNESVIEGALDNLAMQIQQVKELATQANELDPAATDDAVVAALAAQVAAEAAQAAAEVAQAGAEAAATTAIDDALDPSTGHHHDGTDSRKVLATDLDVTGITDGHFLKRSGSAVAGSVIPFSNVIYRNDNNTQAVATSAVITTTNLTTAASAEAYKYWSKDCGATYLQLGPVFRWTKVAGVNTLTVQAKVWQDGVGGDNALFKLVVGTAEGISANVANTVTTPTLITWTVDVSALVDGTTYDCNFAGKKVTNTETVFMGEIGVFAS